MQKLAPLLASTGFYLRLLSVRAGIVPYIRMFATGDRVGVDGNFSRKEGTIMKRKLGAVLAVLLLATPLALVGSDVVSAASDVGQTVELDGTVHMAQSSGGFWQTVREWVCHPVAQLASAVGSGALSAAAITTAATTGAATATVVIVLVCNWEYFSRWVAWPTLDGTPLFIPMA